MMNEGRETNHVAKEVFGLALRDLDVLLRVGSAAGLTWGMVTPQTLARIGRSSGRNTAGQNRRGRMPVGSESAAIPVTLETGKATLSEVDSFCRARGLLEPGAAPDPARHVGFESWSLTDACRTGGLVG
jgi:hypothetical protein